MRQTIAVTMIGLPFFIRSATVYEFDPPTETGIVIVSERRTHNRRRKALS